MKKKPDNIYVDVTCCDRLVRYYPLLLLSIHYIRHNKLACIPVALLEIFVLQSKFIQLCDYIPHAINKQFPKRKTNIGLVLIADYLPNYTSATIVQSRAFRLPLLPYSYMLSSKS